MIQRVVLCKLKAAYAADVQSVMSHTAEVLGEAPAVLGLEVGAPADPRSQREWDFAIFVRIEDMEQVEVYRAHAVHRDYYYGYLKPMLDKIRVYNFELPAGG